MQAKSFLPETSISENHFTKHEVLSKFDEYTSNSITNTEYSIKATYQKTTY